MLSRRVLVRTQIRWSTTVIPGAYKRAAEPAENLHLRDSLSSQIWKFRVKGRAYTGGPKLATEPRPREQDAL